MAGGEFALVVRHAVCLSKHGLDESAMSIGSSTDWLPQGFSSSPGEPPWELALSYPRQGDWTEEEFLALENRHYVELVDGCLEFLPMPTLLHQMIVKFLHRLLDDFVKQHANGEVLFAPLPVHVGPKHFRDPDVVYCRPHRLRSLDGQPEGADLVVEVVSEGKTNRKRDLEVKPKVYAAAGIEEYWIVDPQDANIQVLTLGGDTYQLHGKFVVGDVATSVLLNGFSVSVLDVLTAGGIAARE